MTPVVALRTLLPIAHALAVAHDKGIVHRDLKPENVFLARAEDGQIQPKLLDFGVAKQNVQGYERLTQAGTAVGSPAYMSPEQARGEEVGPQSDVWSFSVVLYEALSGVLPFHDENYNALMRQIIEREPTPLPDLAAGDAELWDILARGLTKDLDRRWDSMRSIGSALAHWLLDRGFTEDLAGASLASTWHHSRQSWVDSDGMFERVIADSGLREVAAPPRIRDDHPSKTETLPPPSRDSETPAAGTPARSPSSSLRVRPTVPAPSGRSFTLLRNLGIALVGAVITIAAVTYFLSSGTAPEAPAPVDDPPAPEVRPQRLAPAKATPPPAQAAAVVHPTEQPAAPASPAPRATQPAPSAARTDAKLKESPQPAPQKPRPEGGGLEIKTTF
jgi:serine/threonine-protein kinase